jgi:hypothetical protein
MPLYSSIIGQCSDCCTCPTPTIQWDSRSASKTKCGAIKPGEPNERYRKKSYCYVINGIFYVNEWALDCDTTNTSECAEKCFGGFFSDGGKLWKQRVRTITSTPIFEDTSASYSSVDTETYIPTSPGCFTTVYKLESASASWSVGGASCVSTYDPVTETWSGTYTNPPAPPETIDFPCDVSGLVDLTETLTYEQEVVVPFGPDLYELPYTTDQLKDETLAALPAWDDDWNDTAGSYRNLTTDELTLSIRESKYRFRFKIPKIGNGSCYKLEWVERFIPALTYDSMGAVTGGGTSISSFTVVNGGSGYTSGATVTISAPTAYGEGGAPVGGTTATGTVVVDTSPSSPTFGQITAVNVSNAGSRYTSAPSFWISGTGTGAVIHIHLGTETPKTWTWDGTPPGGYDPADSATWPLSPEYTIPVPEANGTTTVANLKTACTGCT